MIYEIFNDVLGPVMRGPSSSHTAGPARIGRFISYFVDEPVSVEFTVGKSGSYASMFSAQGSDRGFIGGLLGFTPDAPELARSMEIAKERGISVSLVVSGEEFGHPNYAKIAVTEKNGGVKTFETRSIGGGAIRIDSINGEKTEIDGGSAVERNIGGKLYRALPVLPNVIVAEENGLPFTTADEMLAAHDSLYHAALEYEKAVTGKTEDEIRAQALEIFRIMEQAVTDGFSAGAEHFTSTYPKAAKMRGAAGIDMGAAGDASLFAVAAMENNIARGRVVASPTGGACGVLPGVLTALKKHLRLDDGECIEATLAAGICGLFIARNATFAAEECGCQAEVGAASCMSAAAAAHAYRQDAKTAMKAAAVAMQNMLGLICDPVNNAVEVPCITRNAAGAVNALCSADLAMRGIGLTVGFDETIRAMYEVGHMLPRELRCTGEGGLCVCKQTNWRKDDK